jgi:hypothetical protein
VKLFAMVRGIREIRKDKVANASAMEQLEWSIVLFSLYLKLLGF